ncbi:hypothetical protein [Kribbella sp. NPDC049584]|uniref:hypothetical protein n=1 Tax=Kribbella sp. NPDC049584 TaxID=3154833 RepID=UPI0034485107
MDALSFIVHPEPALRSECNYIARIGLAPFEFDGQVEQVWLSKTTGGDAMLCCIPFRAYGLGLRDTVRISAEDYVIALVKPSRNRALRALSVEATAEQIKTTKQKSTQGSLNRDCCSSRVAIGMWRSMCLQAPMRNDRLFRKRRSRQPLAMGVERRRDLPYELTATKQPELLAPAWTNWRFHMADRLTRLGVDVPTPRDDRDGYQD